MVALIFPEMTGFIQDRVIASFKIPERLEIVNGVPLLVGGIEV